MKMMDKLKLCWRIVKHKESNLLEHADREVPKPDGDKMQIRMNQGIKELLLVFSTHGHSGFSAGYATQVLGKLLAYEPLGPLTGEDCEWTEVSEQDGPLFQNKRCSHVFKDNSGAYDIQGRIFRDPDGSCWTNGESRVPVTFPYTPTRVYVDQPAEIQP